MDRAAPDLRIVGSEQKKQKSITNLMSSERERINKYVPEHKRKRNWEPWTRTKAIPISIDKIRGYYITLKSEIGEFCNIMIWTEKPVVSMRRICSKPRSIRELQKLDKKIVDDINL